MIKRNKSLSDEIEHSDLIYCFKNNTPTKEFNDFENYIKIFRKKKKILWNEVRRCKITKYGEDLKILTPKCFKDYQ